MVVPCPSCGHVFSREESAGGELCCPKCHQAFALRRPVLSAAVSQARAPSAVAPRAAELTADFQASEPGQSLSPAHETAAHAGDTRAQPKGPGPAPAVAPSPTVEFVSSEPDSTSSASELSGFELLQIPSYEVLRIIGHGAMGVVLQARHRQLGRLVAIKLPIQGRPGSCKRLLRESHSAARLRHPNICPIHEVGEVGHRPYIVMEFIAGPSLREWARQQGPSNRRAAQVIAKLARALGYAHQHGVIHRDMKPTNVIIDTESGEPVLTDFGLAKESSVQESHLTQSGQILGTPAYMAPEQAAGRTEEVGPWSDIYGLGATLYELLCGAPPFDGPLGEVLWKVQTQEPASPRRLNRRISLDLETICLKAMAKAPADRYATGAELADDLDRYCAGQPIQARRKNPQPLLGRSGIRLALAGALLAALAAGVLLIAWARWSRSTASSIELPYSLVIEATGRPDHFQFSSPDLQGFSGAGRSIDDCIGKAGRAIQEHIAALERRNLPVPPPNPAPRIVIENEKKPRDQR